MTHIVFTGLLLLGSFSSWGNRVQISDDNKQPDLSFFNNVLTHFFEDRLPFKVNVVFKEFQDGYSKFNCATNTIFINSNIKNIQKN